MDRVGFGHEYFKRLSSFLCSVFMIITWVGLVMYDILITCLWNYRVLSSIYFVLNVRLQNLSLQNLGGYVYI